MTHAVGGCKSGKACRTFHRAIVHRVPNNPLFVLPPDFVAHLASTFSANLPEEGFAIEWKITSREAIAPPDGAKKEHTPISEMRLTQFVEGPLATTLFTIPTGFLQVEHIERNPPANLPSQWSIAWDRFKASVARLFQ